MAQDSLNELFSRYIVKGDHQSSDYFKVIRGILGFSEDELNEDEKQTKLNEVYRFIEDEIVNVSEPSKVKVSFGTSGWRGFLGKEINVQTVSSVTSAIVQIYQEIAQEPELQEHLHLKSFDEVKKRGCVVGHDNRFAGPILSAAVVSVLVDNDITVYYAGESTTGVLSASVLELGAAFSINLTPSHNPLEYGGYKFNAADAGPAASAVTQLITQKSNEILSLNTTYKPLDLPKLLNSDKVQEIDSLLLWQNFVKKNQPIHTLNLEELRNKILSQKEDLFIVIDSVHGASRLHMQEILGQDAGKEFHILRDNADVTFGGIAPEPSSSNLKHVNRILKSSEKHLKLGAIIDPDGDRIRFSDGTCEISMNQFGAMSYHFLCTYKKVRGPVAKTVATSNFANQIATVLGEEVYESRVGFKEFKPVIGQAVVLFEESDGISIIGHTPEKDAYIGLVLALEMMFVTGETLGQYLERIESEFGAFYPEKDSVSVTVQGEKLLNILGGLEEYRVGDSIQVGDHLREIAEIINIDGYKIVFQDGSWLMIRPSGTEPKVRFYVESRDAEGTAALVETAKELLKKVGVLD